MFGGIDFDKYKDANPDKSLEVIGGQEKIKEVIQDIHDHFKKPWLDGFCNAVIKGSMSFTKLESNKGEWRLSKASQKDRDLFTSSHDEILESINLGDEDSLRALNVFGALEILAGLDEYSQREFAKRLLSYIQEKEGEKKRCSFEDFKKDPSPENFHNFLIAFPPKKVNGEIYSEEYIENNWNWQHSPDFGVVDLRIDPSRLDPEMQRVGKVLAWDHQNDLVKADKSGFKEIIRSFSNKKVHLIFSNKDTYLLRASEDFKK